MEYCYIKPSGTNPSWVIVLREIIGRGNYQPILPLHISFSDFEFYGTRADFWFPFLTMASRSDL